MNKRVTSLIESLGLKTHPEGGYYREVFRSSRQVVPSGSSSVRSAVTTIYFLLSAGQVSRWHRVVSDEIWHYYEGSPLKLFCWNPDEESLRSFFLGPPSGETTPVQVIPGGCWQAAHPLGEYTLAGCCVAPGFEFPEFTLLSDSPEEARRLRQRFPEFSALI